MLLQFYYHLGNVMPDLVTIELDKPLSFSYSLSGILLGNLSFSTCSTFVPHINVYFDFHYYHQIYNIMNYIMLFDTATPSPIYTNVSHLVASSKYTPYMYLYSIVFNNIYLVLPALLCFIYNCLGIIEFIISNFFSRLYFILNILFCFFSNLLFNIICIVLANNSYLLLFFILLMHGPTSVLGFTNDATITLGSNLIASLGTISFILTNTVYDYFYSNYISIERGFNSTYILNSLFIGLVFSFNIFLGVSSSTSLWIISFGSHMWVNIIGIIGCFLACYISSTLWLLLANISLIGNSNQYLLGTRYALLNLIIDFMAGNSLLLSLFSSIIEAVNFTLLSWLNFALWYYWSNHVSDHVNLISLLVGLAVYVVSSYLTVYCEMYFSHIRYYGIVYVLSFSSLSFLTNGLIFFWIYDSSYTVLIINLCISAAIMLIFPLEIYSSNGVLADSISVSPLFSSRHLINIIWGMFYFLVSFYGFASFTYIIYILFLPGWFT